MTVPLSLSRTLFPRVSSVVALFTLAVTIIPGSALTGQREGADAPQAASAEILSLTAESHAVTVLEQQRRPLAMISADFNEDGVADLAIGYGLNRGGAIELMRGNHDAIAPQSRASWLSAGRHETTIPFLSPMEMIRLTTEPDLLAGADLNGDGHLDLVYAARGSSQMQAMLGTGKGTFLPGSIRITLPGSVTALAAYRPGGSWPGEAMLVGYQSKHGAGLAVVNYDRTGLRIKATYALPGAATAISVANLDDDFIPDAAIVAGGQLLVLHGKNAIDGAGRLESLPVSGVESVTAGEFIFDRHAVLQLAALTSNGNVLILAHQGFDSRPYAPEQIAAARRGERLNPGSPSLAQLAGDTASEPWTVVETDAQTGVHASGSRIPLLLRTRASGSGGDDVVVLNPSQQERLTIGHSVGGSIAPVSGSRIDRGSFGSDQLVAAVAVRVNADGRPGLAVLTENSPKPSFTVPSANNTYFVNTFSDNTGSSTDDDDGTRCSSGSSETCTLRDAVTFVNADAADNIAVGTSDTIMLPAGTYTLTWLAGTADSNGSAFTHLEVLGPATFVGDTSGQGVTINAGNNDVAFTINPGPFGSFNPGGNSFVFDTTLENITIVNGTNPNNLSANPNANDVGGGINWDAYSTGNLTLDNVTIEDCTVRYGAGGGLWVENSVGGGTGTVTLIEGSISNNSTAEEGGGVYVAYPPAALSVTGTVFNGNTANPTASPNDIGGFGAGGGLYFTARPFGSGTSQSTLSNVTISSNNAAVEGGGIYTNSGIQLSNSVVQGNSSGEWGGGVYAEEGPQESGTQVTNSEIVQNSASTTGGGVYVGPDNPTDVSALTMSLSRIFGNSSTSGTTGLATASPGTANATDNWWGCNAGPTSSSCDEADSGATTNPWAVLELSANIVEIPLGGSINLTVSLNTDSNGSSIAGAFPAVAANYPYSFNVTGVTTSPALTTGTFDSTGTGTATLTATSSGEGTVSVSFDNQILGLDFAVSGIDHFGVSAPSTASAGTPFNVAVTAYDSSNEVVTGYTGIIHFLSTDGLAVLPADAALTNGTGNFPVTLKTAGIQTVSVVDTVTTTATGTSGSINVTGAAATHFAVNAPSPVTGYGNNVLTVTALDQFANVATGYSGVVKLTSTDPGFVNSSGNKVLINGVGSFNFVLKTTGVQSITAQDTVNAGINGVSGSITVDPPVTLSATSLSFGTVNVGSTSTLAVTLTNTGTVNLTVSAIGNSGASPTDFSHTSNCGGISIAPNGTCSIQVSFTPASTGSFTATLNITDTAGNSPQSITLSGTGANLPLVKLSATTLSFPVTAVSTTSTLPVTLTNTGTANLTVSAINNSGANPTSFGHTSNCGGVSIAPNGTCTIQVTFTPSAAGSFTATLNITDNAGNSPQSIALSGTGANLPIVKLSVTSLSFAATEVGATSTLPVTLTNTGTANLMVSAIGNSGTNSTSFSHTSNCGGVSIAPNATCTIQVSFTPAATGNFTAALNITDNATNSPQSVALSGTGANLPVAKLSATSLSFPATEVGATGTIAVTLTNTGTANLTVSAIGNSGTNPTDFGHTSTCGGVSIAPNGTCTIQVKFTPLAVGSFSAALNITDNATNNPQSIALSGTGTNPPAVSLSATSLSFPSTQVGSTSTISVTLTNTGLGNLTVSAINNSGTNSADFGHTSNCGGVTIVPNGTCTIHVTFTPQATGSFTGSLIITDNALNSPQSIALSGTGASAAVVQLSTTSLSFPATTAGKTATLPVTVTNTGAGNLSVSAIGNTGANPADFSHTSNCGGVMIAPNGTCTIQVTFTPLATGSFSAILNITDNATGSPQTVALSGTGQ